jgi:6-phospho-3-hexuloisomerase
LAPHGDGDSYELVVHAMNQITEFVKKAAEEIDGDSVRAFIETLSSVYSDVSKKILVMGAGRSGLVGKAFAMRLMHMGFNVYVLGETIVPSVRRGDVVIAISGSGRTQLIVAAAEAAKKVGAFVIAITTYPESPLGSIADLVVRVPGRTKMVKMDDYFARQILGIHEPLAPLGTLFEDATMVFLDSVIYSLMRRLGISEDEMRQRHANIEL